jgi:hypothetical protein
MKPMTAYAKKTIGREKTKDRFCVYDNSLIMAIPRFEKVQLTDTHMKPSPI